MTVAFKEKALGQEEAYEVLEEIMLMYRNMHNDNYNPQEDLVMELMDFVSDWCHPKDYIWK
jgi:hypothetical protein